MILNDNDNISLHSIKLKKAEFCVGPKLVPVRPTLALVKPYSDSGWISPRLGLNMVWIFHRLAHGRQWICTRQALG